MRTKLYRICFLDPEGNYIYKFAYLKCIGDLKDFSKTIEELRRCALKITDVLLWSDRDFEAMAWGNRLRFLRWCESQDEGFRNGEIR